MRARRCRAFLNAQSTREVIFVRQATEGLNLVAYAWGLDNLGPGDLAIVTELEHHSNFVPWQQIAKRTGAEFRMIPIDDQGELRMDLLDEVAAGGNVKVVAANLVSNSLGTINPIEKLAAWAHEQGAIMVVDAAQAAPHRRIDVQTLGADFVAFSSHKMCGPTGVGVLWGRRELLESMSPFNYGGSMIRSVKVEETLWNELPYKFEAGTPAIAEAYGLGVAIDYLEAVGLEAIEQHEHELAEYALEQLAELPFVTAYGPPAERRVGLVSFNVDGVHPHDVAQVLDWEGIAIRAGHHCCQPLMTRLGVAATNRASFYLYTIPEEIDRLVAGLRKVKEVLGSESEFDQLYREVILDHYKNPRGHGVMEDADAEAEGQNPLCGDEVSIYVAFGEDGDTIDDVMFSGRGCAISPGGDLDADRDGQGPEGERGRGDAEGGPARGDRDPAHARAPEVRDPRADDAEARAAQGQGDAAPRGSRRARRARAEVAMPELDVCPVEELPPGEMKIVARRARSRSGSTTSTASTTRSRTAARTTTARSARASSTRRRVSSSARATERTSTSARGDALTLPAYRAGLDLSRPRRRRDDQNRV